MTTTHTVMDFVHQLQEALVASVMGFSEDFNFSVLVEQKPIQKKYSYVCKVLAIIIQNKSTRLCIHYDKIQEHKLTYLEIKENKIRKVGDRKTPFWVDGNSKLQSFKDNDFIDYSLRNPTWYDLKFGDKVREKYNVSAPRQFSGAKLTFNDDDFIY
jgi:hypothetical protein